MVDAESGSLLGQVPGLNGAHGVALALAEGHGFASSGRDSSVTMFDLKTYQVLKKTTAADDADAISTTRRHTASSASMAAPTLERDGSTVGSRHRQHRPGWEA